MDWNTIWFAFGLTLFAGLSTGIGSAMAFFAKRTNTRFLSLALGFSAGVMIYVSFVEIFFKAREELTEFMGDKPGTWVTVAAFFGGMLLIALIDRFIPKGENPHEINLIENMTEEQRAQKKREKKLMRMGMMTGVPLPYTTFRRAWLLLQRLWPIPIWVLPLPWPLPFTISQRELPFRCPFIMLPAAAARLSNTVFCLAWLNP